MPPGRKAQTVIGNHTQGTSFMKFEIIGEKLSRKNTLKANVFFLIILLTLIICYWLEYKISEWSLVSAFLFFIAYNVEQKFKKRFERLIFDSEENILSIQLASNYGKFENRTINLEELNLEVDISKWKWLLPTKVYFLKNKTEIYELNQRETMISDCDIENLIQIAQKANVPITFL
jgi:hypothetical protein